MHNVSMPNILIRSVPEQVHSRLAARAKAAGLSLQQFCLAELERLASAQTAEEAVQHIRDGLSEYLEAGFEPIGPNDAVAAIREMRDELPDE